MTRVDEIQKELQELIDAALHGRASVDEANALMAKIGKDGAEEIRLAAHNLIHFLDDDDIRERDPSYDKSKRDELQKWLNVLHGKQTR